MRRCLNLSNWFATCHSRAWRVEQQKGTVGSSRHIYIYIHIYIHVIHKTFFHRKRCVSLHSTACQYFHSGVREIFQGPSPFWRRGGSSGLRDVQKVWDLIRLLRFVRINRLHLWDWVKQDSANISPWFLGHMWGSDRLSSADTCYADAAGEAARAKWNLASSPGKNKHYNRTSKTSTSQRQRESFDRSC